MRPSPGEYTAEYVVASLEEAGRTLAALPITGARPVGYRSNMPDVVREFTEAYGYSVETLRPAAPSSRAISEMDEALSWISLIPKDKFVVRRVLQCRAMIHPLNGRHIFSWGKLAKHLHCDFRAAQRWHAEGIATIVTRLNQPGLCALAGGAVGPSPRLVADALARIKAAAPVRRKQITSVEFA